MSKPSMEQGGRARTIVYGYMGVVVALAFVMFLVGYFQHGK